MQVFVIYIQFIYNLSKHDDIIGVNVYHTDCDLYEKTC